MTKSLAWVTAPHGVVRLARSARIADGAVKLPPLLEEVLREVPEVQARLRPRLSGALGRLLLCADTEAGARAQVARSIAFGPRGRRSGGTGSQYLILVQFFGDPRAPRSCFAPRPAQHANLRIARRSRPVGRVAAGRINVFAAEIHR